MTTENQISLEGAVLGGLINLSTNPDDVTDLAAKIEAGSLVGPRHELLLKLIVDGASKIPHEPVTVTTLATAVAGALGQNRTELVGWLTDLCDTAAGHKSAVAKDLDVLKDRQLRQRVQDALTPLVMALQDPAVSAEELQVMAGTAGATAEQIGGTARTFQVSDVIEELWDRFDRRREGGGKPELSTGSSDLDRLMGGCEPGKVTVVAARPGHGKTVSGCDFMRAWLRQGASGIFFSTEMPAVDLMGRMFSAEAEVDGEKITKGTATDEEISKLVAVSSRAIKDWSGLLVIEEDSQITPDHVRAAVTRQKRLCEHRGVKFGGFVVDYVQRLPRPKHAQSEQEAIAENMVKLASVAKDLKVHAVILAQFNRQGGGGEFSMGDMKGSGQIEQEADIIWGLHVPAVDDAESPDAGLGFWHCLKHRSGPGAGTRLKRVFQGEYSRFVDHAYNTSPSPTSWGTTVE